jgi:hypothetical protein
MTTSRHDEHLTMVADCENREEKLTAWERTFIDSIKAQLETDRALTEKQREILDRIWDRVT